MAERLLVNITDHVATVTLNREGKHNAVDRSMFDAIIEVGSGLADDASLRAVVLTGAGPNFCAGIDVSTFAGGGPDTSLMKPLDGSSANYFQSAAYVWRQLPVPVIAALKGVVFGAGLQIAMGADLRIAAADVQLSIMEARWGLVPDMAMSTVLPGLMPYDKAAELTWTGRIVGAEEAIQIGLVTQLAAEPVQKATEIAALIARQSPDAVRAAKQLLQQSYTDRDAPLLALEAALQTRVMAGSNHREAVSANVEKRAPVFGDSSV